jgi:hypothetical protein
VGLFDRPRRGVGIALPTYTPPAARTVVIERTQYPMGGKESGGQVVAYGADVPLDEQWMVEHAYASCTSTAATTLVVYAGAIGPQYVLDGSSAGNADTGDWPLGLLVPGGSKVVAVWTGASAGAVAFLNLQITRLGTR